MAAIYHNDSVDIELESGSVFRSFLNHTIGSGDNNANWYGVHVFRNGEPVNLEGCSVQGIFMPSSGSAILISDSTHTWVNENEAAVLLPQACYNVKGQFTLAIKIIGTNSYSITDTVRIIDGVVADTYSENPVAPTAAVPTYQEILAVYDQMVAAKDGSVRFDIEQSLTDAQKEQARDNIAAASESDVSDLKSALIAKFPGDILIGTVWQQGNWVSIDGTADPSSIDGTNTKTVCTVVEFAATSSIRITPVNGGRYQYRINVDGVNKQKGGYTTDPRFYNNLGAGTYKIWINCKNSLAPDDDISPNDAYPNLIRITVDEVPFVIDKTVAKNASDISGLSTRLGTAETLIAKLNTKFGLDPLYDVAWQQGQWSNLDAVADPTSVYPLSNVISAVTGDIVATKGVRIHVIDGKYSYRVNFGGSKAAASTYVTEDYYSTSGAGTYKIWLSYKKTDNSDLQPGDGYPDNIQIWVDGVQCDIERSILDNANRIQNNAAEIAQRATYEDLDESLLHSRNLIGTELDTYYPVSVATGKSITITRSDGTVFPTSGTTKLNYYDASKTLLGSSTLNTGYKTLVITNNYNAEIAYLTISVSASDTPLMVNYGGSALPYVAYYKEVRYQIQDLRNFFDNLLIGAEREIINSATSVTYNGEFIIESGYYYALKITRMQGRDLSVQGYINGAYVPVLMQNIHTGMVSSVAYDVGEYLILGIGAANKIKVTSAVGYQYQFNVSLVQYGVAPLIASENRQTAYLPKKTSTSILLTNCFGVYDGYAYGFTGSKITRAEISSGTVADFYTHTVNIVAAMIFDNGNIMFCESASPYKMYLLSGGTATEKHTFYTTIDGVGYALTPNQLFSMTNSGGVGVVSEYYSNANASANLKAYVSTDYGVTWNELFDLASVVDNPETKGYHLHSACYDPYGDMYWVVNGDTTGQSMIWYSLDGTTWQKIHDARIFSKATSVVPMRNCVLFLSDSPETCIYKWTRRPIAAGSDLYLDVVSMIVRRWGDPCPIGANGYYDAKNDVAYVGFGTSSSINSAYAGDELKHSDVYVTDGYTAKIAYQSAQVESCVGVYGDGERIAVTNYGKTILLE